MSTASFSLEPLAAPTLKATDVDSVRTFLKKYREYLELWEERVEDGTIDEKKTPKNVLRCTDIYLRERISKYELGKPKHYDDLQNHLTQIIEGDTMRELSLEEMLSRLKFDANQHDPAEKVGQVFQHVERQLEKHGAAGLFPDKKIAKIIVAAVQPKELRRRVEYELATVTGKRKMDKLPALYNLLVEKYKLWYELFPDVRIPSDSAKTANNQNAKKGVNQQNKGEVNSKKNKGNQEKKGKPNVNTPRTPICYVCDGQDHWSSKCPDKI